MMCSLGGNTAHKSSKSSARLSIGVCAFASLRTSLTTSSCVEPTSILFALRKKINRSVLRREGSFFRTSCRNISPILLCVVCFFSPCNMPVRIHLCFRMLHTPTHRGSVPQRATMHIDDERRKDVRFSPEIAAWF